MPCIIKVRISGIRNINAFEKYEIDSFKYLEVTLGETKQRTKFNISKTSNDLNLSFRLEISDDSELQTCPLKIAIDDAEDINSGYIQIDFSFFYFHDNLKLEGWFPLYDSLEGIKGELYCTIKWEFFEEKNPYNDNSAVLLLGTTSFPKGSPYYIEEIIGFAHELKIVNDPEYDWKDFIRSSRNSNEARCDVIQNSFMEVRKYVGKKAKILGGNAILGYREHLNLEGSTTNKICIRIIGTVVKLGVKGFNNLNYINISENNNIKNILRNNEIFLKNIPEKYKEIKFNRRNTIHPNSTSYNFVDVILLTVDSLPKNIKYQYGGLVASKSVKVLHPRLTEQHRDEWLLEIRDELKSNATFLSCNVILGYKEDAYIFNDVIVLFCYGTAINVLPSFFYDDKIIAFSHNEQNKHSQKDESENSRKNSSCIYLHYASKEIENSNIFCRICNDASVPKILISSSNAPKNLAVIGNGFLISAFVVYPLKKNHGENLASEISEILPFLELNLHKQIICKLLVNGFNSIFDYNLKLCFNNNYLFGYCYGTGMCTYGIYYENKFLIKSNYKDNFYIRNKCVNADELKIIYDNINYRSFFSKNKSLVSPVFINGDIIYNIENDYKKDENNYKNYENNYKKDENNSKGEIDKPFKQNFMNVLNSDIINVDNKKISYKYSKTDFNENALRIKEPHFYCQDVNKTIKNDNYFRLKEIYLKEEKELLNEDNYSDNINGGDQFYRKKNINHIDNYTKLGIKERKRIKKKKEKKKARRIQNKGYIYEVEDHLDNITLLNIYEDSIALYNYVFNLDIKSYLLNKRYDIATPAKKNEVPIKNMLENIKDKKETEKTNYTEKKQNCVKKESMKEKHKYDKTFFDEQIKIKIPISIDIDNNTTKCENNKKNSNNNELDKMNKYEIVEENKNKILDDEKYPNDILLKKNTILSLPENSENNIALYDEYKKEIMTNYSKYFFYICTLDFLPSIKFETFYEQINWRNENEQYNNAISNSEYLSDSKLLKSPKKTNKNIQNTQMEYIQNYEYYNKLLKNEHVDDGEDSIGECHLILPNPKMENEQKNDLVKNKINYIDEENRNCSLFYQDGKQLLSYTTDKENYYNIIYDHNSIIKKTIYREQKREKKKEKKRKNRSKNTYLNNLSKSYIYLIKRINLFGENNDEVDVIYEKINKAFNDLYNIFIFYTFVHNLYPCCICSIRLHFSFIACDVLEIMLTGHLIKVKNNKAIHFELKNLDQSMQENLLKHFFNHLENYYMERSEFFFNFDNFFSSERDDKASYIRNELTKKELPHRGLILASYKKKKKNNNSNLLTHIIPNIVKYPFCVIVDMIRNMFKSNETKKKNEKDKEKKKMKKNEIFHLKDGVQKEKDTKKNKINKFNAFLKKGDKKINQSYDMGNIYDNLFMFSELKNYIMLENNKHLFDTFIEHKFSSIIITPLNILPNVIIKKYFGVISLHIVKENINLKKFDFFYQSLISDILYIAKSHIKAIGANLISSFKITNIFLREEKSHGYALISICGDVAKI
ncbi:conserved Plasmodium protein, unknown function [Plasmodium berghei]|uniref:C2 domain-containing protein n=2 Tax=Plasmodium berghei TaxID=5821 RepID=A0A509AE60_PLABA|nr:conserved Plasmodium protein, unknown function [Plasmodium berghei ANKA]SCM17145.1 conserved Plasmodium protein, unknown function [Plasmodium berghei]SCN22153.1 conserved Plasmodium protein, unknown function [Plasmodium berghei]VUC54091.1 conserved Plasmodium protein, unknown function [Plasmodium berghei ANKA]|eukprot:XP_034419936.1 conserved Plasmodium protein, unknown function [Plasmodium berghei ANKA]